MFSLKAPPQADELLRHSSIGFRVTVESSDNDLSVSPVKTTDPDHARNPRADYRLQDLLVKKPKAAQ